MAFIDSPTEQTLFDLIWSFNYDGVGHLNQMAAIPLFVIGLRKGITKDLI